MEGAGGTIRSFASGKDVEKHPTQKMVTAELKSSNLQILPSAALE